MADAAVLRTGRPTSTRPEPGSPPLPVPRPLGIAPVWPLVGRDRELHTLTELLDVGGGAPGVVLAGPAGVGKTRLAREALAIAAGHGATACWAAATSSGASIPLGALSHLLPPPGPESDADSLQPTRRAIDAIRDLGGGRPVVLGVDDSHLLDDRSAALVHQIAISGAASLILTLRSDEPAPEPVVALWKDQLVPRLDVDPLGPTEVTEVVAAVVGGPLDSAAAARFWRLTLGNPLFLREVVLGALDGGQLVERSGLWRWQGEFLPTSRLTELVRARVGRLPADQRALAETVAFGEPLSATLAVELSSEEALRGAEERGVVSLERTGRRWEVRMAHPLYAEVVKAECPPMRARDTRRGLVAAQAARGLRRRGDVLRQATLQVDADGTGDADLLVAAATQANTLDPKVAERMARAALASGGGFPARLALSVAFRCQGEPHQAQTVVTRAAAEAATDDQRAQASIVLAQILFWDLDAGDEAEAVLAEAPEATVGAAISQQVTALRASFALFTGRPRDAIAMASPLLASESKPFPPLVHASAVLSHALGRCGRVAESLEANARGHAVPTPARTEFAVVLAHAELTARRLAGLLDEAEALASAFEDRWGDLPGGGRMPIARLFRAQVALARGRPATAAGDLEAVVTELGAKSRGAWLYWALLSLAEAVALTGNAAIARRTLRTATAGGRATLRLWEPDLLVAEAWVHAANGELTRAVASSERAAAAARATGQSAVEAVALHTCTRLGHRDRTVPDRLEELAREVDSPFAAAAGVHAPALVARDGDGLDAASASFSAMGADLLAAEASNQAAVAHREAGRRASELASSRRAADLARACEGARTPALDHVAEDVALTRREREVAGLAARGLTNRAIAERLVVSVRTVENHLDRVYTKLGLHSRAELAVAFSVDPPAGGAI